MCFTVETAAQLHSQHSPFLVGRAAPAKPASISIVERYATALPVTGSMPVSPVVNTDTQPLVAVLTADTSGTVNLSKTVPASQLTSKTKSKDLPTPLHVPAFKKLLPLLSCTSLSSFVLHGLEEGFDIGHAGATQSILSENLPSALEHASFVSDQIASRVLSNESAGPFAMPPFDMFVCSPLSVVPKSNGKLRLIHHLSFPDNDCVNAGIDKDSFSLQYVTVDDAISFVRSLGRGALMAKLDIRNAFRLIPVSPACYHLLGFKWQEQFYFDKVLPFGLRSAPYLFNTLADILCAVCHELFHIPNLLHLLDDFWLCGPADSPLCKLRLDIIMSVFKYLGVPIAGEKTEGPTTNLTFLGIELDSVEMVARLPENKMADLRSLLHNFRGRRSCRLRELQHLLGKLNFASRVVVPGRTFMRRLYDATRHVSKPYHHVRLPFECQLDLHWWSHLLEGWNGKSMFLDTQVTLASDITIETDASGSIGFGALCNDEWFAGTWRPNQAPKCITYKELYPICLASSTWGHKWCRKRVLFLTDNAAIALVIQSGTSRCPNVMSLLRQLFFICAKGSFMITARHIPGITNTRADALSRQDLPPLPRTAPICSIHTSAALSTSLSSWGDDVSTMCLRVM